MFPQWMPWNRKLNRNLTSSQCFAVQKIKKKNPYLKFRIFRKSIATSFQDRTLRLLFCCWYWEWVRFGFIALKHVARSHFIYEVWGSRSVSQGLAGSRSVSQGLAASRSGVPEHTCISGKVRVFRVFHPACYGITIFRKVSSYVLNNTD